MAANDDLLRRLTTWARERKILPPEKSIVRSTETAIGPAEVAIRWIAATRA